MFENGQVHLLSDSEVFRVTDSSPTESPVQTSPLLGNDDPSCARSKSASFVNKRLRFHRPSLPLIFTNSLLSAYQPLPSLLSHSTPSSQHASPASSKHVSPCPSYSHDDTPCLHTDSLPFYQPPSPCSTDNPPTGSPDIMAYLLLSDSADEDVYINGKSTHDSHSSRLLQKKCFNGKSYSLERDSLCELDETHYDPDALVTSETRRNARKMHGEVYSETDSDTDGLKTLARPSSLKLESIQWGEDDDDRTFIEDSIFQKDDDSFNNVLPMEDLNSSRKTSICSKNSNVDSHTSQDIPCHLLEGKCTAPETTSFEKIDFTEADNMSVFQRRVWQVLGLILVVLLVRVGISAWQLAQQIESVHNWTTDDVEMWLKDVVGLPQYLPIFKKNKIDGNFLPRLALNTDHLIQTQLGISDLNHKNKLILKAMDLVLFGPPTVFYNPLKDALLALAILVAVSGLFFSTVQRRKAQHQIGKMLEEVDKLQVNEQKFIEIQSILHKAEVMNETVSKEKHHLEKKLKIEISQAKMEAGRLSKEREITKTEVERLTLAEQELAQVRSALNNAESKNSQASSSSKELQLYLKLTYRKEREQYNIKKAAADKQLEAAKQWGLKMKKKRTGVVNSLKMIHGNSLEAVEGRISSARSALIEATSDLQELSSRWRRIETLCNVNITTTEADTADPNGSQISLVDSDSNASSPEPSFYSRSNSTPSKAPPPGGTPTRFTQSLRCKEKGKNPKFHGSSPNLVSDDTLPPQNIPRNASYNAVRDLPHVSVKDAGLCAAVKEAAKLRRKLNGHIDSATESDESGEKRRKGKSLWQLVRESRLNSDQKWKDLITDKDE